MTIDKIRNSFLLFCKNMEPDFSFADVHRFVCGSIQEETIDQPDGRVLLSVPPGFGKSTLCSQMLPAFILGQNPKAKILLLTYGANLSNSHGKKCRRYMETAQYKAIFSETSIAGQGESGSFETHQGGSLKCVGRGGSITGFRANFIIIDDCIKNSKEASSDVIINGLQSWFSTTAYSRLLPGGSVVAFNTIWTKRGLIYFILDNYRKPGGEPWTYYNLPAIATGDDDLLGRKEGEPLWPEFYPLKTLLEIKKATPKTFGALYQGNPTDENSTPIKKMNILSSSTDSVEEERRVISWDTASTEADGDYTVATVWSLGSTPVLINIVREQVDFVGLQRLFKELDEAYSPDIHIVENASSGRQLIQLNPEITLSSGTIKNKTELATAFNYSLSNGDIKILNGAISATALIELSGFPYEKHDDIALSILHFYKNWRQLERFPVRKGRSSFGDEVIFKAAVKKFNPGKRKLNFKHGSLMST